MARHCRPISQSTERQIRCPGQISCVLQGAGCAAVASQQQPSQTRRKMAGITKAFSCRTAIAYRSPRTGLDQESASLYSAVAYLQLSTPRFTGSASQSTERQMQTTGLSSSVLYSQLCWLSSSCESYIEIPIEFPIILPRRARTKLDWEFATLYSVVRLGEHHAPPKTP